MRRAFLALTALATIAGGCHSDRQLAHTRSRWSQYVERKVYHWRDGRYATQDDSGFWFWFIYSQTSQRTPASISYTTNDAGRGPPQSAGAWTRGSAPTKAEEEEAEEETIAVEEDPAGEPVDAQEEAGETAGESAQGQSQAEGESHGGEASGASGGQSGGESGGQSGGESGGGSGGDSGGGGGGDGGGSD